MEIVVVAIIGFVVFNFFIIIGITIDACIVHVVVGPRHHTVALHLAMKLANPYGARSSRYDECNRLCPDLDPMQLVVEELVEPFLGIIARMLEELTVSAQD